MVNAGFTVAARAIAAPVMIDPERALALSYAPAGTGVGIAALFALDDALAAILRSTREPMLGQIRLTWWHDALSRLDTAPPPAEPVLRALAAHVVPRGVMGARLADMIDGWEALLDPDPADAATLETHAGARGIGLFAAVAMLSGGAPGDPVAPAGRGWALADLALHVGDPLVAAQARTRAAGPIAAAAAARWSRPNRVLGALVQIARMDLAIPLGAPRPIGAPRRVGRLLLHRLTGR